MNVPKLTMALLIVSLALFTGCTKYYKTVNQTPASFTPGANGLSFSIVPISFEGISREPGSQSYMESWNISDVQKEWVEEVLLQIKAEEITSPVRVMESASQVTEGILVESKAISYRDEYSRINGGYLFMTVELSFTEVSTGKRLFTGSLEVSSHRLGPIQWRGVSLSGRIALASWNVVPPIMYVIKKGKIDPETW